MYEEDKSSSVTFGILDDT